MTTAFINFIKSKYMCSYLESITNYTLHKESNCKYNFPKNLYFFKFQLYYSIFVMKWGDTCLAFENTGAVICEVQFWKSSCYSVLTDKDPNFEVETLDIWLFFNVQEDTCCDEISDVQAGNIYYWKKNDTTVVSSIHYFLLFVLT